MNSTSSTESDALVARRANSRSEPGRDWAGIGIGVTAAFALVALYVAGAWAIWVVAEALI